MTEAGHIAYVSADGLLEPIGYSQVFRLCVGFARRGLRVTVLSSEWPERAMPEAVAALQAEASRAGVIWEHDVRTGGRGAVPYSRRTARLVQILRRVHERNRIDVNIVRGFPVGAVGVALAAAHVPFIYDNRGFWVDQRLAHGTLPRAFERSARAVEAAYYRKASASISLTETGAAAVRSGRFGRWSPTKPSVCIPTCVDFDAFSLDVADVGQVPAALRRRLEGKLVVAFIGSMNKDYLIRASFELAKRVLAQRPDAVLLVLSSQQAELGEVADQVGIEPSRMVRATASQREMPAWLSLVTWGLLLLETRPAKGGSMPTKLGELLASGVRPVHTGCNAEVGEWVRRAGSGLSLADASDRSLDEAAARIAHGTWDEADLLRARCVAEDHFSLERGVDRYLAVVDRVAGKGKREAMHTSEPRSSETAKAPGGTDGGATGLSEDALTQLRSRLPELAERWRTSKPFHYLVVDDFLPPGWAERIYASYPQVEDPRWSVKTFVHQAKKYEMRQGMPQDVQHFFDIVESEDFLQILSDLTGVPKLLSDPERVGGGLHQIDRGGFLDVHVDYNLHPRTKLHRRLNLLLYMNKQWRPDYRGYLEFWNMTGREKVAEIEPRFNRAVLFETTEQSFHGHPVPLETPVGITRKSLAVYYYTAERDQVAPEHNTVYKQTTGTRGYLKTLASSAQALQENVAATGLRKTVRKLGKRVVRMLRGGPPENG